MLVDHPRKYYHLPELCVYNLCSGVFLSGLLKSFSKLNFSLYPKYNYKNIDWVLTVYTVYLLCLHNMILVYLDITIHLLCKQCSVCMLSFVLYICCFITFCGSLTRGHFFVLACFLCCMSVNELVMLHFPCCIFSEDLLSHLQDLNFLFFKLRNFSPFHGSYGGIFKCYGRE